MQELTILPEPFEKTGIGRIRIALLNDEPMFNLYDSCFDLGYVRPVKVKGKEYEQIRKDSITKLCENLDITGLANDGITFKITYKERDKIDFENTWINEQNFYDLCLGSHTQKSKPLRKWVTGEVLPSIRKTGGYNINGENNFNTKLESLKLEQQGLKFAMELLNPSKASSVKMLKTLYESQGLSTIYLPIYVDEEEGHSLTELLKKSKISMSAVKFNKLLVEKGYVTEESRPSTNKNGFKKYKKLTNTGLEYGKNKISTYGTEKETVPLYYESKFQELVNIVLD